MKYSARIIWIVAGILFACVCMMLSVGIGWLAWSLTLTNAPTPVVQNVSASPTLWRRVTVAPTLTETPAPTNTLVIQPGTPLPPLGVGGRTPTRGNLYNIVVPTPTAVAGSIAVKYETKFTVNTYNVPGKTLRDISSALNAQALPDPHEPNSRYYARTDWYLTGDWYWKTSPRGCELDSAQVRVAVTLTLPALLASDAATDVQKRWDTFIENTITHENGHVKLAYDGARNYQREMDGIAPAANCETFQTRLKDLFRKNFDQIDRANSDYDARTKHGETQGAIFP